ncbi:MAG: family 43 glycosylhydrolase [Lachnospiraceae bacterium]|nr:family 43 glycosylhydrolase [Lachnospiraceae bacterium]
MIGVLTDQTVPDRKQAYNPYLPNWEYIPDGEPYVFGDRVYVYGSHDQFNGYVFCQGDYVCWSAPINNLGDWRYEGVTYKKTQDPVNSRGNMVLYAPDVTVGPDGRYYLYYVLDKVGIVSVAVCDTPAGKYEFYGYVHYADGTKLGEREGDEPQFDPGVLTEGDTIYLFTGFCGRGDKSRHGSQLTVLGPDMLTIVKDPRIVVPGSCYSEGTGFEGHAFFEASSIRKFDGKYYFIYSSEVMHELCYATSDSPEGPFTYGGVIVSNSDFHIDTYKDAETPAAYGANNHGSLVEIGDKRYIFYHRQTNATWYSRQGCAEEVKFAADGSIKQVEITSCGLNGGPLRDTEELPAHIACNLFNKEITQPMHWLVGIGNQPRITQDGRDGDENPSYVANIGDGTTIGFKYINFKGVKEIELTVRGYIHDSFEVRTELNGPVIGTVKVDSSDIWEKYRAACPIPDGVSALYLTKVGGGNGHLLSVKFIH